MKRYWKLAVLVPFIVVCIGFYYTKVSGSNVPEFFLKLQEGNEKEASPLIVQGQYRKERLSITSEGSESQNDRPFWESWNGNNPKLEKLRKEHPQFMRGKNNPYTFYENDQVLGYVDITPQFTPRGQSDFRFNVSVYDKKQKNTTSFEIKVPKEESYTLISLYDIRIDGTTMKLITYNHAANEKKKEAHLYTLDLEKKNVTDDQVIVSADSPDEHIAMAALTGAFPKGSTNESNRLAYQIYRSQIKERVKANGRVSEAYHLPNQELFVYDISSGKLEPIQNEEVNELLQETPNINMTQTGDDLYLTSWKDSQNPRVIRYSLAEKKVKSNLTIALNDAVSDLVPAKYFTTANNRLYMLYNTGSSDPVTQKVAIAELDTGVIVYKGTFSRKDGQDLGNLGVSHFELR